MSMRTLKKIRSALLFCSFLVITPLAVVIETQRPASALHECKWWELYCTKNHVTTHTTPRASTPTLLPTYESWGRALWPQFANPFVSTKFSSEERAKIWRSLEKAQAVVLKPEFYTCIEKYVTLSTTGEYDGTAPGTGAAVFLGSWPTSTSRNVYIDHYTGAADELGWATRGIAGYRNNPNAHFKINLNAITLKSRTEEQIAGTIIHELLHNWGYKHDQYKRTKNDEDRRGNFVYEAGWCATRGGLDKRPNSINLTGENENEDEFHVDY